MTAMERDADVHTGAVRLGVGFVQGLCAWGLIEGADSAFAKANPALFAVCALLVAFPPLIVLAAVGRMRPRNLAIWVLAAAATLAALGFYDLWREPLQGYDAVTRVWPSPQLIGFAAVALYAAHHLIEPADVERRIFASYEGRFEAASRHAFQLVLSALFTLVFWGVLQLGAALFDLIGVKALSTLLRQTWFVSPATATAFAAAVHLTDVRPALILGFRTLALTLLSWLLPLMAGLTALFLVALLFTGVEPLWATRRASALLLSAAAVLILLINTVYQDGAATEARPAVLRWAVRGAALLLVPLVGLAAWANGLRIAQYGLTPERVAGVFVLVVAVLVAVGYAWAALAKGPWMRKLEAVNVAAAIAVIADILLVLSPIADPARLSAADQVHRLQAGRVKPDAFDFAFLRFHAARFGRGALADLARSRDPAVATAAKKALAQKDPYPAAEAGAPLSHAAVLPAGAVLPESFRRQVFEGARTPGPACLYGGDVCDLHVMDVTGDGAPEVLAATRGELQVFAAGAGGRWSRIGEYGGLQCDGVDAARLRSAVRAIAPQVQDLQLADGRRLPFRPEVRCDPPKPPAAAPAKPPPPGGLGPAFGRP